MNKEEKSLLDELWDAAGLNETGGKPSAPKEIKGEEISFNTAKLEEIGSFIEKTTEKSPELPKNEEIESEIKKEEPSKENPETKKKDIKFLVIYTIIFVIVISGLIGGSYMITSRIHQQMSVNNQDLNMSQSTLKNIQDENASLRAENAALKESNAALSASATEAEELLDSVGDMVEQDSYLTAAQSAYIDGNWTLARQLMTAIDREKLSQPAKGYYDLLKDKLGL